MNQLLAKVRALLATKYGRIVKRVVVTAVTAFAVTFGALATDAQLFTPSHVTSLSLWETAAAGAWAAAASAALAAIQSAISQHLTGTPTVKALLTRKANA